MLKLNNWFNSFQNSRKKHGHILQRPGDMDAGLDIMPTWVCDKPVTSLAVQEQDEAPNLQTEPIGPSRAQREAFIVAFGDVTVPCFQRRRLNSWFPILY